MLDSQEDPYAVLGIARGASASEAKSAYRRKIRSVHPDLAGDRDPAELDGLAAAINLAWKSVQEDLAVEAIAESISKSHDHANDGMAFELNIDRLRRQAKEQSSSTPRSKTPGPVHKEPPLFTSWRMDAQRVKDRPRSVASPSFSWSRIAEPDSPRWLFVPLRIALSCVAAASAVLLVGLLDNRLEDVRTYAISVAGVVVVGLVWASSNWAIGTTCRTLVGTVLLAALLVAVVVLPVVGPWGVVASICLIPIVFIALPRAASLFGRADSQDDPLEAP